MGANNYSQILNFNFVATFPEIIDLVTERCQRAPESTGGKKWIATGNNFSIWVTRAGEKRALCEGYCDMDNPNWQEHILAILTDENLVNVNMNKS